jgi:hypothetical protein
VARPDCRALMTPYPCNNPSAERCDGFACV